MPDPTNPTTNSAPLPVLRTLQTDTVVRAFSVDTSTINEENRTVEIAVSSEYPVRQWFGMEVLDHSPEAIDMTRFRNGAPSLAMHDRWTTRALVGVVEEAWLDPDRRLRARIRFSSNSEEADLVWKDVRDRIRQNVSVGYIPREMVLERSEEGLDHYRVTRWEPFEVSWVSVPADPTVGVGRSISGSTNTVIIRGQKMPDPTKPAENAQTSVVDLTAERTRVADILAWGERFGQRDLANEAIAQGHSVDQFSRSILERQAPGGAAPKPLGSAVPKQGERDLPGFTKDVSARSLGLSDAEIGEYSLMRAIEAAASKDWSKAGLERQVSNALGDVLKKEARGFYVPHDLLMRGMSKGDPAKGGAIVATDLRMDQFVDILRNKTVMASLGMRMLGGLVGDLDLPKKISGSNFHWLGEGQDVTLSDFDLTTLPMSPKTIAGGIPVTRRLRKQSSRSIEALIIDDLIEGLGVAIDYGILRGPGTDNQLLGLLNQGGIPALEFDGPGISFGKAVDMRTKVATFNAAQGALAYLTSVSQAGIAQQTEKFAGTTGRTVWEDGKVNGYRAEDTNQMPDDTWLFGDFSQVVLGMWGVMDLKVDDATLSASDGLVLRVFQDVDAVVRNKSSFSIAKRKAA
ncbi:Phage capsid family protein [compost metagenome]